MKSMDNLLWNNNFAVERFENDSQNDLSSKPSKFGYNTKRISGKYEVWEMVEFGLSLEWGYKMHLLNAECPKIILNIMVVRCQLVS